MKDYQTEIYNLLESWLDESYNSQHHKQVVSCLVQWLSEDDYWFIENCSLEDANTLKELASKAGAK